MSAIYCIIFYMKNHICDTKNIKTENILCNFFVAMFLLDNGNEIWLWKGILKPESNVEQFNKQVEVVNQLLNAYVKEKRDIQGIDATIQHASAGQEPTAFTNIFPYWKT